MKNTIGFAFPTVAIGWWLLGSLSGHCYYNSEQFNHDEVIVIGNREDARDARCSEAVLFSGDLRTTDPMALANHLRFCTKYQDEESGMAYYGYRYYNPSTGRWLSRDPIGERGGANLLGLNKNDPCNAVDNLGLSSVDGPVGPWDPGPFPVQPVLYQCDLAGALSDTGIRQAMDAAWAASNPDGSATTKKEHGFWILCSAVDLSYWVNDFGSATRDSINPGSLPGSGWPYKGPVGHFHTHPNTEAEGYILGPSDADMKFAQKIRLPGVVRSFDGLHFFGPNAPSLNANTAQPSPKQKRTCPFHDAI